MRTDVLVIGAGLAGSTSARILAEKGYKVLVVERLNHIAGHCFDYKNEYNITIHKYGPHIFHTNDKDVWDFVNKFINFYPYQHKVLSYVEGNLVPFPINRLTLEKIFSVQLSTNDVKQFLLNEVKKSKFNTPPQNFKDAVVSQVGERLYELFFKNYTKKQWELEPEELDASIARRIPVRDNNDTRYFSDKYQGIPVSGYTKMVENMLNHKNIKLLLQTDYFEIKDQIKADMIIYTGELDRFFNFKYGKLQYRSLRLDFKTYDKKYFQKVAVVNYPNDYDWTRITEFKHFLNEESQKTTVCFEYPEKDGEPYYVVLNKENNGRRDKYFKEIEKIKKQKNIYFIGRLAEYKYYNMDQVIKNVLMLFS